MLLAFIIGLYLAARSQWHWPLVILSLITILFWTLLISSLNTNSASDQTMDDEAWICAAVSTLLPVWWFAIGRWRYKAKTSPEPT
jgi:hypothetical protein